MADHKLLAEDRARQDSDAQNSLLSTTLQLYVAIGLIGMVAIMLLADWLVRSVFQVPAYLVDQTVIVFRLAGIGFLGGLGISWGSAVAMGLQRFDLNYSVSSVLSIAGTLIGLWVLYSGYGIVELFFTRTLFTLATGPVYFVFTRRLLPDFNFRWGLDKATIRRVEMSTEN